MWDAEEHRMIQSGIHLDTLGYVGIRRTFGGIPRVSVPIRWDTVRYVAKSVKSRIHRAMLL